MEKGKTQAQQIRATKRKEILDSLRNRGLLQQVLESTDKLADLSIELDSLAVNRIKAANDTRLSLIKKYLPDVKQTELVGEGGGPVETKWTVEVVDAALNSTK